MKKILAILLTSFIALGAMAQAPVYRVGDKYMRDGTIMNKKEFKGYLKNTCPEAYELFNNGHKLSVAGWWCFGVGLGVNSMGSSLLSLYFRSETRKSNPNHYIYDFGTTLTSIGSGLTIAGITCLSVGYTRMHKSVNLYNIEKAHRPDLRWVFGLNNNGGMSVAMQF